MSELIAGFIPRSLVFRCFAAAGEQLVVKAHNVRAEEQAGSGDAADDSLQDNAGRARIDVGMGRDSKHRHGKQAD